MKETITVVSIEEKTGQSPKGQWTRYTCKLDNNSVRATFDKALADTIKQHLGKRIVVETEINGQYKNLMAFISVDENIATEASGLTVNSEQNSKPSFFVGNKEASIIAQALTKCVAIRTSGMVIPSGDEEAFFKNETKQMFRVYKNFKTQIENDGKE